MAESKYSRIIEDIFWKNYREGATEIEFTRADIVQASHRLGFAPPKNLGDVVYSLRYRQSFPQAMQDAAPEGMEWCIRGRGDAAYALVLTNLSARITPNENLIITKIPDATPEIIRSASGSDEQALLAIVRYNRLVDIFLGISAYSLQNHLRTKVRGIGQVEVDEMYVALDSHGQQYIVPVEAKGHNDQIGRVQTEQDLAVCSTKWPEYTPVAVAVQFMTDNVIAMFELILQNDDVRVVKEKHYELVKATDISEEDRAIYRQAAMDAKK